MEMSVAYQKHSSPRPVLLLALVLITLAIPVAYQCAHAALHDEASTIRACAEDPANLQRVFLNSSGERLNCLVQLPDGRTGDHVIQWSCRQLRWLEITNYVISDGSLGEAIRTLLNKGCTQVYP